MLVKTLRYKASTSVGVAQNQTQKDFSSSPQLPVLDYNYGDLARVHFLLTENSKNWDKNQVSNLKKAEGRKQRTEGRRNKSDPE